MTCQGHTLLSNGGIRAWILAVCLIAKGWIVEWERMMVGGRADPVWRLNGREVSGKGETAIREVVIWTPAWVVLEKEGDHLWSMLQQNSNLEGPILPHVWLSESPLKSCFLVWSVHTRVSQPGLACLCVMWRFHWHVTGITTLPLQPPRDTVNIRWDNYRQPGGVGSREVLAGVLSLSLNPCVKVDNVTIPQFPHWWNENRSFTLRGLPWKAKEVFGRMHFENEHTYGFLVLWS